MAIDFRREYQIAWIDAECTRIEWAYPQGVVVIRHVVAGQFTAGRRMATLMTPSGASAALCITQATDEGASWRADLIPVDAHADVWDVPKARPVQTVRLEMRYGRCHHRSYDETVGRTSGHGGIPDFAEGVAALIGGRAKVRPSMMRLGDRMRFSQEDSDRKAEEARIFSAASANSASHSAQVRMRSVLRALETMGH